MLNALYKVAALGGDTKSHSLLTHLLHKSSVPYFNMLSQWIYEGLIKDPFGEFMIREKKDLDKVCDLTIILSIYSFFINI